MLCKQVTERSKQRKITVENEIPVAGRLTGIGFDTIELNYVDVKTLSSMRPNELHYWMNEVLSRFN